MSHHLSVAHPAGEQSHQEWNEQADDGPNFGLNANFKEFGEVPRKPKGAKASAKDEIYRRAFASDVTYTEAMDILYQEAPRDMAIHGEAIARNLQRRKKKSFEHKYYLDSFIRGPLPLPSGKSIFLHGPSGVGKTHYACAHFQNPLLVSDIDQLKEFNAGIHDGIVFDDMSFHHIPPEKVIHLVDRDFPREIRCRHTNASIPAGTKKIFTHNSPNPFYSAESNYTIIPEQEVAIARRLDVWNVPFPLYKSSSTTSVKSRGFMTRKGLNGEPVKPYLYRTQERIYYCDGQNES